jgi:hypothetical protein
MLIIISARVGLGQWDAVPNPTDDGYPAGLGRDELVRLGYPYLLARVQAGEVRPMRWSGPWSWPPR